MATTLGSPDRSGDEQIGNLLVEGKFLTEEQFQEALALMRQQHKSLREILADKMWVNAETFTTFLSLHSRFPIVDLQQTQIEQAAIDLVPEDVARQHVALPLTVEGDSLRVAMDNPLDTEAINILATVSGKRIKPRLPLRGNIREFIDKNYPTVQPVNAQQELLGIGGPVRPIELPATLAAGDDVDQSGVVKAVNILIAQAVKDHASEIHLEFTEDALVVWYHIAGVLKEQIVLPLSVRAALISRFRDLAGPTGNFTSEVEGKQVSLQVIFTTGALGEEMTLLIKEVS